MTIRIEKQLREEMLEKAALSPLLYDRRDIDKVCFEEDFVQRFLVANQDAKNAKRAALVALDEFLQWRNTANINNLSTKKIPGELYEWGLFCGHFDDTRRSLTIFMRACLWTKNPEWNDILKDLFLLTIEQMLAKYSWHHDVKVTIVIDYKGSSVLQADLSFLLLICKAIQCYPDLVHKYYIIDLPWFARPFMKTLVSILPAKFGDTLVQTSRPELRDSFQLEHLPVYLGGALELAFKAPAESSCLAREAERTKISPSSLQSMQKHICQCKKRINAN
jgi:hypothetical protein